MTTVHYQPLGASNSMRLRPRLYIWDERILDDARYDIVAMERALNGEPTPLNNAEKYETARILYRQLRHVDDLARRNKLIAERVGVADRTILRWADAGWPDRDFTADGAAITAKHTTDTIADRFNRSTEECDGHLIWTAGRNSRGVPQIHYMRRNILAARWVYEQNTGIDPEGVIRPDCGRHDCVRFEHLRELPGKHGGRRRQQAVAA